MPQISRIRIFGLFDQYDVEIPVSDNRLILVGANGLGKSTILSAVFSFLSRRWHRLMELPISAISVAIDGEEYGISTAEIAESDVFGYRAAWRKQNALYDPATTTYALPPYLNELLFYSVEQAFGLREAKSFEQFDRFINKYSGIPWQQAARLRYSLRQPLVEETLKAMNMQSAVSALLLRMSAVPMQGLMNLPTYRRIEREFRHLFPELQQQLEDVSLIDQRVIEFVEFGMRDVEKLFVQVGKTTQSLCYKFLSDVAVNHLRDIIRDEGDLFDKDQINDLDNDDIRAVLSRYDATNFTDADIDRLFLTTERIKHDKHLNKSDPFIAHYLGTLSEAAQRIDYIEQPIKRFVSLINTYLSDKEISYDQSKFTLSAQSYQGAMNLNMLSSGEKQIVSLFAHTYLRDEKTFIFIDEPELSLSVNWQERFLPDLAASPSCEFLFAVTHSPFVFDNHLERYVVDARTVRTARN